MFIINAKYYYQDIRVPTIETKTCVNDFKGS